MAGNQPARGGVGETMDEFAARRRREQTVMAGAASAAHQDYGDALRSGRDVSLPQTADVAAHGAALAAGRQTEPPPGAAPPTDPASAPGYVGHPGFAESLIPVWGSGREAVADLEDHDYAGAALNGALAISDLSLAGILAHTIRKAAAKGGIEGAFFVLKGALGNGPAKARWPNVRKTLGKLGLAAKDQDVHHWLIPQGGLAEKVPDLIKNHPLNLKPMPTKEMHGRINNPYLGKPRFNPAERYLHGTPGWSKVATGSAIGHSVAAAKAGSEDK